VPERSFISQTGARYIPELAAAGRIDSTLALDMDLSLNCYAAQNFHALSPLSSDISMKPYRAWLRLSSSNFELRGGLQKINFGSATLFRPLMWFDKVDPRDPLQLTDGVYGLLARYYFLDNANVWLWALYGNNETKGLETVPTTEHTVEYGGRVQTPLWTGELGATYHHRQADFLKQVRIDLYYWPPSVPEDRFALDGKWDIGIGAWFEAALTHDQIEVPGFKYQRQWTVGADYTFDLGNGLTALTEYFRADNPELPFGPARGLRFSALSLNYPLGVIDRISGILYRDWTNLAWYRLVTWQRTYDNWIIYILGFWNPTDARTLQGQISGQAGSNPYAGSGVQIMVVFNH